MTYEVISDVPLPAIYRDTRKKYPFNKMDVGDSFAIPVTVGEDGDVEKAITKATASVRISSRRWALRHKPEWRFVVRRAEDELRCWRVA